MCSVVYNKPKRSARLAQRAATCLPRGELKKAREQKLQVCHTDMPYLSTGLEGPGWKPALRSTLQKGRYRPEKQSYSAVHTSTYRTSL